MPNATGSGMPAGRSSEDIVRRPWGLQDFRVIDPDGYYLRITHRAR